MAVGLYCVLWGKSKERRDDMVSSNAEITKDSNSKIEAAEGRDSNV